MSETKNSEDLCRDEIAVIKRVLSGKEKIYKFDNAKDAIKHLNAARQKARHKALRKPD